MKSTKAGKKLEQKKRVLEEQFTDLKKQTEEMHLQIEKAPRETIEVPTLEIVNGKDVQGTQKVVVTHADQRLLRDYDDAMRTLFHIEYQIREIEFLLSPPKGRPKGRRNEQPKLADPTMLAALEDWKNSPEPKPGSRKLAFRHCKVKTEEGRKRWMYRFKKFREKAQRSQF